MPYRINLSQHVPNTASSFFNGGVTPFRQGSHKSPFHGVFLAEPGQIYAHDVLRNKFDILTFSTHQLID